MAWVPIAESGLDFTINPGGDVDVAGSTLSCTNGVATSWNITFASGTVNCRVTVSAYEAISELPQTGHIYNPATIGNFADVEIENQAAPYPDSNWPDENPVSAFTPSPVEVSVNADDGQQLNYSKTSASEWIVTESWTMLVEVDVTAAISYNCECDDDYPRKTLAEMRAMMATRLGWAAQVAQGFYPPGIAALLDSFLQEAQELAYRSYKVFRLERFFTWDMVTGVRFYDLPQNADVCTKKLDPRMVNWVGISQDDNFWRPLICGIKPEYYYGQITGWPMYYEIRQCIEVWPPPSDDTWKLRIKGYFELMPFAADDDESTIDYRAIFLLAMANAKAHFGQPDAANYASQYREFIGNLTAGSHHTRRYIPDTDVWIPPPLPILTGYPGDP